MTIFRSQKVRNTAFQVLFVGGLIAILLTGILTAWHNLAAQNITSSFAFLWKATGWEMNFSLLPTSARDPYWWYILMGICNTLFLGVIGLFCATLVGGLVGLARVSENKAARLLGTVYVEIFRNIPLIVQIFFWYSVANRLPSPRQAFEFGGIKLSNRGLYLPGFNVHGWAIAALVLLIFAYAVWIGVYSSARRYRRIPQDRKARVRLIGTGLALVAAAILMVAGHPAGEPWFTIPELKGLNVRGGYRIQPEVYTLAFAIAIYGGAYIGEIVRGGFKSVGRGQTEAAQALGLSGWQAFSRIRLPLAMRAMLPILANQYVWLIKATTLGIVVGFSDLFMVIATSITQSGQTLEFIGILMASFLIINFSLAKIFNRINKAVELKGHQLRS